MQEHYNTRVIVCSVEHGLVINREHRNYVMSVCISVFLRSDLPFCLLFEA